MGATTNSTSDGLPVLDRRESISDTSIDGLPILKKKDAKGVGSLSPSDSSPKPVQTAQPVDISGSDPKQVTANYKNNSLTASDVPGNGTGPTPDQVAMAINNKGKNLDKWKNSPSNQSSASLLKQKNDVDAQISGISNMAAAARTGLLEDDKKKLEDLSARRDYLNGEINKNYNFLKDKLVPELTTTVKGTITDSDFNPETHTLRPKAAERILGMVDGIMNKRNESVINAAVSGDLDSKQRTYADIGKSVIDNLNLIPIQQAQQQFTRKYAEKNPSISEALKANEEINDYFSHEKFDDLKAKVNVQADKEFIQTQHKYYGDGGIFMKNQDYVGIQHKYAQLVGEGKMTDEVARKQMEAEISQNPSLKKIKDNYDSEIRKVTEKTQKQYEQYLVDGLQKKHPQYTIYPDGTPGLASLSQDKFTNMMEGYQEGMDGVAKKMGAESNEACKKMANEKANRVGPFWGSMAMSGNDIMSGLTKWWFNKTGFGGEKVRNFEATEIASPQVSQSDVAATWNWKGWESLLNPNFYLSSLGSNVPVLAGATAVTATTEGAGLPEYVGWLSSAGLFTAQSSLSTYDRLLNSRDEKGNLLSESDAAHFAAEQAQKDFLPNVLMMALGSGTLMRAKNIVKPTILGTIGKGIVGAAEAQPFLTWQGYNDYSTMLEAQGKKPDMFDYLQSKEFRDNLVNGLVIGGGISMLHAPLNYMKSMDNWTKMVHTSEGEFKNLIPQNYALGQEMAGNGNYLRDALKLHVFNIDPEGLNEEGKRNLADLNNTMLYSINLDKNIRTGNLDRNNINDLYQAHNLALADQHDYLAEQAAKEGNKSLSDIYKDKAKDYREQAKAAANGEAKYHYLTNDEGHPIFMSDKSFKFLEKEGTLAKWMKDGTVKDVHSSDDPEFAQRYKDFVTTKSEAAVEGKDVMDHASDLIEQNKDKLGTYYAVAKDNPEQFYRDISEQASGYIRMSDGRLIKSDLPFDTEKAMRDQFGDDIVDLAKVLYPITEKEGGSNATTEKQGQVREGNQPSGEQEHTRTGSPRDEKTQPRTDSGDSRTDGEGEKVAPEDNITVSEMLYKKGTYKGQRGTFVQDGQAVIFKVEKSNREYELGNIGEVGGRSLKDFGIDTEKSVVNISDDGKINVRDKEYVNPNEDPLKAIVRDEDGNVVSVKLETQDGQRRTFRGQVAEDLAYELTLKQISDNHEQPALEDFINQDEAARSEIENAGLAAPTEEPTTGDNPKVQREKIEPKIEPISSPKTAENAEKTKEAEGRKGDVLASEEGGDKQNLMKDATPPPSPPKPTEVREPEGSPKEEFTAVRKEKNAEIKGAKELFDRQKVVKWTETYDNALSHVQAMYPDKGLYDAMHSRVQEFVTKLNNGVLFNPTSEDIAVFNVYKNETIRRMGEIPGWDSSDNMQRMAAVAEFTVLQNDLFNVARVTNPGGEAGRSFNLLKSEIAQDPDYGLKIRRMELLGTKGGGKLTEADMEFTSENWEKEKALLEKEHELREKGMKEKFDKEMAKVKDDYEKRLKDAKVKKPTSQKEKREQLLKEKGAELAAKIRKGKDPFKGATMVTFPGLPQTIDFVLEGLAKLVEGGFTLAQAIDNFVAEHKVKNRGQFQNDLFGIMEKRDTQEETYAKIQKMAVADGSTDVTKDMVAKNLIKKYVDSHVGLHDTKDVLDVAHAGLKQILPDLEKERLREAYLKQGEFKPPTKKELESGLKQAQRNFEKLTYLEKDINDLTEKGDLYKKTHNKPSPYEKEIDEKQDQKKSILDSMGVKTSGEDKYKKASYDQRAKMHNERLGDISKSIQEKIDVGELSEKSGKALLKLKNQLDAAMIKIDPTSALSQERTLDAGLAILKGIKSEFQRSSMEDISKIGDVNRMLQKAIEKFSTDKDETEQDIKLQRAKDQSKRSFNELSGKLSRGEFEDTQPTPLTKTDAELIKLERERGALSQLYRNKQREYEKANKTPLKRVAEFVRAAMVDWMIGAPFTLAKVAGSAILRPTLETLTRLTVSKGFELLPFETTKAITERAKLGGESSSIKSLKKGYEAYLRQYSKEQLGELYAKANDRFEKADKAFIEQQAEVDRVKYMGKDKPEYTEAVEKLEKLKNDRNNALVDAVGNSMYEFIGGSSVREGLEVLLHRSTLMERQFGDFEREGFVKMTGSNKERLLSGLDNLQHVMNFVGRSHAALKNFSARFSFATGFMARLEASVKNGVDISQPDKLMEIAHDSYHDWERGKYQESNWVTDTWNKVTTKVESVSPEMAYLMRSDVAITRVPVNMLREGIVEYTLGAFRGSVMAAREYYKAKGIVLQDGYTPEGEAQFREELKEQLQRIDPDKAATIIRSFRKGGLGLGLYAFALLGHAAFGGWAHKGQTAEDKKKMQRELDTGNPELKTSEIQIGDWKMPEFAAKIAEHTPAFYPLGFGLGLAKVYENNITDGRTTPTAALNSAMAQINHVAGSLPMIDKLVLPLASGAVGNIMPSGQWDDVDQDGNPMKRKAFHVTDYFKYLHVPFTQGFKKDILSETYYKQAVATQKSFRNQITEVETNTSLSKQEKEEQRKDLLKQLDDSIDEIYRQNKENPQ